MKKKKEKEIGKKEEVKYALKAKHKMHGQGFPVSSCVCHIYIHPCAYDINRDHILFLLSQQGIPLHSAASLPTATRSNREMTAQRLVLHACTQLASICLVLHKLTIKLNFLHLSPPCISITLVTAITHVQSFILAHVLLIQLCSYLLPCFSIRKKVTANTDGVFF